MLAEGYGNNRHALDQAASLHPFRGLGEPDDIAGPAVFLASEDAKWVTGVGWLLMGGLRLGEVRDGNVRSWRLWDFDWKFGGRRAFFRS